MTDKERIARLESIVLFLLNQIEEDYAGTSWRIKYELHKENVKEYDGKEKED